MELWIDVVGGEFSDKYDSERIVAVGGFDEIDRAILEEFGDEVNNDDDKYFELNDGNDSWTFSTTHIYEQYYRNEIGRR